MEKLILESQTFLQLYQDLRQLTSQQFSTMQSQSNFIKIIFGLRRIFCLRIALFVKFPGRDLGGFFSFFRGFTYSAWFALFVFLLTVPAFLHVNYHVLKYFELEEPNSWKYFWNIFVLFGSLSQQV